MRRLSALPLALVLLLGLAVAAEAAPRSLAINPTLNLPPTVEPDRFRALGNLTAGGWRLRITGETARQSGRQDGANVLGFSPALPPGVLGAYEAWGRRSFVRRCRRTSRGRVCRRVRRDVILEADVSVNSTFAWNQGPRYPNANELDLESVMIHELGHFAAPTAPHRRGCVNSSLVDNLGSGEWWRGTNDWYRQGCPNSAKSPASVGARSSRLLRVAGQQGRFLVIFHEVPRRG
ncbi:MAG: hypothetical protein WKF31_02925 [Thermoleophilaceae bacterium]